MWLIIGINESLVISIYGTSHSWHGLVDAQVTSDVVTLQQLTLNTAIVITTEEQLYVHTSLLYNTGSTPKNGDMGNPGLGVELSADGRGVIAIPPVSAT